MLKQTAVAAACLAVFGLTVGCTQEVVGMAEPEPESDISDILTVNYLKTLRVEVPETRTASDGDLIKAGKQVCERLNDGATFVAATASVLQYDLMPIEDIGYLSGSAVLAFCPERWSDVEGEINDSEFN
jgi:hypothetical protein